MNSLVNYDDELSEMSSLEIQGPQLLSEFNGQSALKENLQIAIHSARARADRLDHMLFHGPPGLGKTTLAEIISKELGVGMRQLTAPAIERPSDIVHVLAGLEERDVLFIDEIHRLPIKVAEMLYPVMESFRLDILVGTQGDGRVESIPLPPFTMIGATTHLGKLPAPLSMRFPIKLALDLYTDEELALVIARTARKLAITFAPEAVAAVCKCSRGTPRIAIALVRRIRDFAVFHATPLVGRELAEMALKKLGFDHLGFSDIDRRYIKLLRENSRPMGLRALSATLNTPDETLETEVEPYLLRKGLIVRTEKGRTLSKAARNPFSDLGQLTLGI